MPTAAITASAAGAAPAAQTLAAYTRTTAVLMPALVYEVDEPVSVVEAMAPSPADVAKVKHVLTALPSPLSRVYVWAVVVARLAAAATETLNVMAVPPTVVVLVLAVSVAAGRT